MGWPRVGNLAYTRMRDDLQPFSRRLEGTLEVLQKALLLARKTLWHLDLDDADEITPAPAVETRDAATPNDQRFSGLRA